MEIEAGSRQNTPERVKDIKRSAAERWGELISRLDEARGGG